MSPFSNRVKRNIYGNQSLQIGYVSDSASQERAHKTTQTNGKCQIETRKIFKHARRHLSEIYQYFYRDSGFICFSNLNGKI